MTEDQTANWTKIASAISDAAQVLAPIVAISVPAAALGAKILAGILDGVAKGLPSALALWNDIMAGKQPTQQDMDQYWNEYQEAYGTLDAAITEQLSKLPAA